MITPVLKDGFYIGIMSGTSLDGLDVAAVEFTNDVPRFVAANAFDLPDIIKHNLEDLMQPGDNEIERMGRVDLSFGYFIADCINQFIDQHELDRSSIIAIGSHGQTIRHRPCIGFTLQIGDPNVIASRTGITTVADIRRRDMAEGGQGAPLVPAFHNALFRSNERQRIILNIGGIANVTELSKSQENTVIGFDTGPGNTLLDQWHLKHQGEPFDANGDWARAGQCNSTLLSTLLADSYFLKAIPKSTGREHFHLEWLATHLASLKPINPVDVQATLLELTVVSIRNAIKAFFHQPDEVFVCGGGARNGYLMERLQQLMPNTEIATTSVLGIHPDWVEACAFAWLAKQTLSGTPGNLTDVTGAKRPTLLGAIYPAYG
jgi:anhydro-N-acetylmuramic acid kinase